MRSSSPLTVSWHRGVTALFLGTAPFVDCLQTQILCRICGYEKEETDSLTFQITLTLIHFTLIY